MELTIMIMEHTLIQILGCSEVGESLAMWKSRAEGEI